MRTQVSKGKLIPAAILATLVYGMIAAMLGTILPELSKRLNLTPEENGTIALTQAIGLMIASVAVGPLIDNKGKKTGLLLGLTLVTISLFALPNAPGFGIVAALFLLLGLGGGIIVTAANALVSDISAERRASTLNLLNLFFGLGGLLTPFIGANLLAGNTIALCYLVAALTAGTLLFNASIAMPPPTGERGFKLDEAGPLLGRPALFLLAALMFLYVACEVGVWNWLARYLIGQGIAERRALNILSLGFALGLLIGRVVVSRILIKVSSPVVTLAASVLMAVTTLAVFQVQDLDYLWLRVLIETPRWGGDMVITTAGVLAFCAGIAMAPVFPTTLAMVGDVFPRMTATAMGIVITAGWTGLAVSSPVIGAIAGNDPARLKTALLLLPGMSVAMVLVNLAVLPLVKKARATVT